jgi:hypothetical protein
MLKITIHDCPEELRFRLEGRLSGPWVGELRQCWQTAASTTQLRTTILDLQEVDFVDHDGQALLDEMHRRGVRLEASCPLIQHIIEEITGPAGIAQVPCGTVERKSTRRLHDLVSPDPRRRNPRAI